MITAKCNKCGGTALGDTFENASSKINHAVGLSRGIKCGANYNMVCEIKDSPPVKPTPKIVPEPTPVISPEPKPIDTQTKKNEKPKSTKTTKRE